LRKVEDSVLVGALIDFHKVSAKSLSFGVLPPKEVKLLYEDDDVKSKRDREGEDAILLNDFGESRLGKISSPMRPLHRFVFAKVALALRAAPDKHEKELLIFIQESWIMVLFKMSNPSGTMEGILGPVTLH
jgi:hypothetical protein